MYDRSGKILWTVTNPNTSVYAVAISADGKYIARLPSTQPASPKLFVPFGAIGVSLLMVLFKKRKTI
jgi:hypothetical protein